MRLATALTRRTWRLVHLPTSQVTTSSGYYDDDVTFSISVGTHHILAEGGPPLPLHQMFLVSIAPPSTLQAGPSACRPHQSERARPCPSQVQFLTSALPSCCAAPPTTPPMPPPRPHQPHWPEKPPSPPVQPPLPPPAPPPPMPPSPPTYPPAPPFPVGTLSGEVVVYTQAQIQQCLDSPNVTTIRLRYFVTLDGTPLNVRCRQIYRPVSDAHAYLAHCSETRSWMCCLPPHPYR